MGWRVLIVLIFVAAAVTLRLLTKDENLSLGFGIGALAVAGVQNPFAATLKKKVGGPRDPS